MIDKLGLMMFASKNKVVHEVIFIQQLNTKKPQNF